MQTKVGPPAHFIAPVSGIGAGLLMHGEMKGIPGYIATLITDSHYVSSESMAGFEPVLASAGLSSDVTSINTKPKFKEILKETNQRVTPIYS